MVWWYCGRVMGVVVGWWWVWSGCGVVMVAGMVGMWWLDGGCGDVVVWC